MHLRKQKKILPTVKINSITIFRPQFLGICIETDFKIFSLNHLRNNCQHCFINYTVMWKIIGTVIDHINILANKTNQQISTLAEKRCVWWFLYQYYIEFFARIVIDLEKLGHTGIFIFAILFEYITFLKKCFIL